MKMIVSFALFLSFCLLAQSTCASTRAGNVTFRKPNRDVTILLECLGFPPIDTASELLTRVEGLSTELGKNHEIELGLIAIALDIQARREMEALCQTLSDYEDEVEHLLGCVDQNDFHSLKGVKDVLVDFSEKVMQLLDSTISTFSLWENQMSAVPEYSSPVNFNAFKNTNAELSTVASTWRARLAPVIDILKEMNATFASIQQNLEISKQTYARSKSVLRKMQLLDYNDHSQNITDISEKLEEAVSDYERFVAIYPCVYAGILHEFNRTRGYKLDAVKETFLQFRDNVSHLNNANDQASRTLDTAEDAIDEILDPKKTLIFELEQLAETFEFLAIEAQTLQESTERSQDPTSSYERFDRLLDQLVKDSEETELRVLCWKEYLLNSPLRPNTEKVQKFMLVKKKKLLRINNLLNAIRRDTSERPI